MNPAPLPAENPARRRTVLWAARAIWITLALLCLAWEWKIAPVRPGGSWLLFKVAALLLFLPSVWRGRRNDFLWALLVLLPFLAEAAVRMSDPPPVPILAGLEMALIVAFYATAFIAIRQGRAGQGTQSSAASDRVDPR